MKITDTTKAQIWAKVADHRKNFRSDAQHSVVLGLSKAAYSLLQNRQYDKTADKKWMEIARIVRFQVDGGNEWITAETPTFKFITAQLVVIKNQSLAGIFCDRAGIGKSHVAKEFSYNHSNVAYIDCSANKGKIDLIRALALAFGVETAH